MRVKTLNGDCVIIIAWCRFNSHPRYARCCILG